MEVNRVMSVMRVVIGDVLLVPHVNVPSNRLFVSALLRLGLDVVFQADIAIISGRRS